IVRKQLFSSKQNTDLEKHRAKLMAKGLPTKKPIIGVEHIILVSSGKGGVGKSTTADTDVYGPSIPLMMNLHDTPLLNDKNLIMSMGFLIDEGSPVIWRGLMVMQALEKLLRQVDWGSIDYLIVDTPPGTGDTHLSLIQNIPITGVILVTTPQSAALQVTKRGAVMFQKLSIPIIGLVENMSSVTCSSCSNIVKIFGEGTSILASEINSSIIESFPLHQEISNTTDKGTPIVIKDRESPESKLYINLAKKVVEFVGNKC
ncbi:iron-sulfur protein NUBPL, partial [Asbolus verrucosus]